MRVCMFHLIANCVGMRCGSAFQEVAPRLTLLWWYSEALYLLGVSSKESMHLQFLCSGAAFYTFYCMLSLVSCASFLSFTYLLHSFTIFFALFRRDSCLNLYFMLFLTQFIIFFVFFFLSMIFNVEYYRSYSIIIVYFLKKFYDFVFSYVVHSKKLSVIPSCCLKGLSALQCAERSKHTDLVSLLSKCLNV